ncbi:protein kinase [Gemmata sp. G18]|uniref:Protein kinase n=1 Tax=Gemmata palustris TaxID=2822762 RepID=A0ABS5BYD3_9BACT|nr:serine/threonine-protein kinase [Gemmata palustris]MBP3958750.1 protein kinase [Gemmata palustris]
MSEPTLTRAPEPDHPTVTVAPGSAATVGENHLESPPGYELHALIGSGGMGAVYRARDLELVREVAVKILLPQYAPDSATARRFVDEAHITGRLQHPSIPAVYRVGALTDGRPFLAMKLIDGQTLEEMLQERAKPKTKSDQPLTAFEQVMHARLDRLEAVLQSGRFLAIFEQVAQAVGYAHQQNVIHRDLKPSNIMVGAFGEVQVMDWGIARSSDRRPDASIDNDKEADGTADYSPSPLRTPHSDLTQAGAILGTPAFMPPEQAIGAIDQIGKRSDVFGLGAILCVILTGQPPFLAETAESARQIAARGKLEEAFARLDSCEAEPELIALAKRCLSPEVMDRPADAGEVASAVAVLRADAERRARQAELECATTAIKVAEERKRRRVQRALALSMLVLLAVVGYTVRRIDNEQTRRRIDQEAQQLHAEADQKERAAALRMRQLVTERDVSAALNEAQVLRAQGAKQADDPERWGFTLVAARSALKRAEALLSSGEPTDELHVRVGTALTDLDRDDRNRALIAELDRIGEENDIRFLLPIVINRKPSERYAAAFRTHGIDLADVPTPRAAEWLKGHPFRARLTAAVRNWSHALSPYEIAPEFARPEMARGVAAVGGQMAVTAVLRHKSLRDRLNTILDAVTEDPFVREWWGAVHRHDSVTLKQLLTKPEIGRMSSHELSSLADGLADLRFEDREILADLLRATYYRFPGEFWVNFRLASLESDTKTQKNDTLRYLSAAVAARPKSAIARVALGASLLERHDHDPTGLRLVHSAAELDPTSPWPHFLLGTRAVDNENFTDAFRAFEQAARLDPDTGFFLIHSAFISNHRPQSRTTGKAVSESEITQFIDALIVACPDHPGGYDLRAESRLKKDNGRGALADYRKAKSLMSPDYARRVFVEMQIDTLEPMESWEKKLPQVLNGKIQPTTPELIDLAGFCAKFDRKYALATRFSTEAMADNPGLYTHWTKVCEFAGWAVQAAAGNGTDAAQLPPAERTRLRRQALVWLHEVQTRKAKDKDFPLSGYLNSLSDLAPVRDANERAKLPANERAEWEQFWVEVPPAVPAPHEHEIAPAPRPAK